MKVMPVLTIALAPGGALAIGAGVVCCTMAKSKNTEPKENSSYPTKL
jgi:hypothetical protein